MTEGADVVVITAGAKQAPGQTRERCASRSTVLDGAYGISGVALSLPSILGHGGVRRVLRTPMDDGELTALQHYADTLPDTMSKLGI